jgi:nucleotide-binding universal stress UspA family protein
MEEGKMYNKILVPLDGSELAECVLPHVETFIKRYHVSEVVFLRAVDLLHPYFYNESYFNLEELEKSESDRKTSAEDYLNQVINRLEHDGTTLRSEVLVGRAAETLIDYVEKNDIDLILIATHGRSGLSRWVMGSVADKVLRSSNIPVLMVRAPGIEIGI